MRLLQAYNIELLKDCYWMKLGHNFIAKNLIRKPRLMKAMTLHWASLYLLVSEIFCTTFICEIATVTKITY